jgi:phage-related minor tail protein
MKTLTRMALALLLALGAPFALTACEVDDEPDTVGEAIEESGDDLEEAADEMDEGVEEVGDDIEEAADDLDD